MGPIVVGTDGSATAAKAVARAAELARSLGTRVHIVSAYEPVDDTCPRADPEEAPVDVATPVHRLEIADAILDEAAEAIGSVTPEVRLHARRGDPADAILAVAGNEAAGLIVVGNRGMTGPRRFLLGSVPNTVSHRAQCDVMIVRTHE